MPEQEREAQDVTEDLAQTEQAEDKDYDIGLEIQENPVRITVCPFCMNENLVKKTFLAECKSPDCTHVFCLHYASSLDPAYCLYCLKDVICTVQTGKATHHVLNEETGFMDILTKRFKSIKFEGLDWLFQQKKIESMSDEELAVAIEYHSAIRSGMIREKEERFLKRLHRNKGVQVTPSNITDILNVPSTHTTSTTTTVKKTRVHKVKSSEQIQKEALELLQRLANAGVDLTKFAK
jgi:hypothetical protein